MDLKTLEVFSNPDDSVMESWRRWVMVGLSDLGGLLHPG